MSPSFRMRATLLNELTSFTFIFDSSFGPLNKVLSRHLKVRATLYNSLTMSLLIFMFFSSDPPKKVHFHVYTTCIRYIFVCVCGGGGGGMNVRVNPCGG